MCHHRKNSGRDKGMGRKWVYPDAERRSLRRVRTIAEGQCRDLCIYFLLYICCTHCRAGLHCGMGCSRAVGEQGSSLAVARPSPCLVEGVSARGSRAAELRLTRCSTRPHLPRFPWDLPGSGVEPASPAWAAGRRLPASSGGDKQGTLLHVTRQPGWEGSLGEHGYVYMGG